MMVITFSAHLLLYIVCKERGGGGGRWRIVPSLEKHFLKKQILFKKLQEYQKAVPLIYFAGNLKKVRSITLST